MELDIVVVTGSAEPGTDQLLHVGTLLIAQGLIQGLSGSGYAVNGDCPSADILEALVHQVIVAGDGAALKKMAEGRSSCRTGCRHNVTIPTGPYCALVSARITNWRGRPVLDYTDPDNPMLTELPRLLELYERRRVAQAIEPATKLFEEITEIYRISLDAARTRGSSITAAYAAEDAQQIRKLGNWRSELRAVNARHRQQPS